MAQIGTVNVDLGDGGAQTVSLAEATISPDGQIILTGEDGTQSSMIPYIYYMPVKELIVINLRLNVLQRFLSLEWSLFQYPCTKRLSRTSRI